MTGNARPAALSALDVYARCGLRENVYGHVSRLAYFERFLTREMRVLDFGCGTGAMTTLPLRARGYDVRGVDLHAPSIAYGRSLAQTLGLDPECLSAHDAFDLSEPFDAVIASEVFEHVPDAALDELLDRLVQLIRPGGRLIVTVPNGFGWFEVEAALWSALRLEWITVRLGIRRLSESLKFRVLGDWVDSRHPNSLDASPHVQRFTWRSIRRLLERHDLAIEAQRGSVLFAGPLSHLFFTGVRPVMAANLALGALLGPLASGFWLVARRRPTP